MPISRFEHVLILSDRPEETRDFFVDVLGLKEGYRPPFPFPGYWLYLGTVPCIHLAGKMANAAQQYYLEQKEQRADGGTGAIDHIAFVASDLKAVKRKLKRHKLDLRERMVPEQNMVQVFFKDPNDITIELNFPLAEQAGGKVPPAAPRRRAVPLRPAATPPRRRAKPTN
jgi:catechol 2,3-dioxygenase-like lactoylglutathione lyase family enzyme